MRPRQHATRRSPAGAAALSALITVAAVLGTTACSGPSNPMATDRCPSPHDSTGGADDGPGQPLSARAVYHPHDAPQSNWHVLVRLDDDAGAPVTEVAPCQAMTIAVVLQGPTFSTANGTPAPGHVRLSAADGSGSLHLVDQPTYIEEADNGTGAQDYAGFTGWYATVDDPEPGRYHLERPITWVQWDSREESVGVLDLTLTVG
jgi:hypothetical protein